MQRLLRWKTRWQINCFVAVCLPLTLGLGAWQLERAETKVELRDACFLDESGSRYLVNRGWLAASSDRGVLPEVTVPGTVSTIGTSLSPDRHLGYAVQWFGLALVLVCGYGFWIWKG